MNQKFRKVVAMILVVLVVSLSINSVFSIAHEIEEAGFSAPHKITIGFLNIETSGHCPACPTDNHPSGDHEHFSCDHHNTISLATQIIYRPPVPTAFALINFERFQFIPEVFPEIATPPAELS